MTILVGNETRLLVQGITGREGEFHTRQMVAYGTNVVGGVRPGKGGDWAAGVAVFDSVRDAVQATGANTSIIFIPARFAPDAILEAANAGIALVVCISEGIPALDMLRVKEHLARKGTRLIGPNCPGLITPGQAKVGIIPGHIVAPGKVGIVSRSGTLTYEIVYELTRRGIGQSTCVGIGGDQVIGTNFVDVLEMFERDAGTEQVVLIGEIGGSDEENAAQYIGATMTKPVTAFIAGRTAPEGKRMGHAGAIISGGSGRAEDKIKALEEVGVRVAQYPGEIADIVAERMVAQQ